MSTIRLAHCGPVGHEWPDDLHRGMLPRALPFWMVAFWMALFIIRPWEELIPELESMRFERMYALAVIAAVVALGRFRVCGSLQTVGVVAFLFALGVSSLFAIDPSLASEELYKYMTLVVFYFILLSVLRTPYQLCLLAAGYVVVMAVYLGKAEYEFFLNGHYNYRMGVRRLIGIETTFGGPNSVAASTVLSLPFLHFLWRYRRQLTSTWPRFWQKVFPQCLVAYGLLAISAIVLTNSRAGMLGVIGFALLVAANGKRLSRALIAVSGAAVVLSAIWLAMPEENQNRLRTVWDPQSGPESASDSAQGRVHGLAAGVAMFAQYPATGVGLGENFIQYRVAHCDGVARQAHNLVGQMLGSVGTIGCVAFLLLIAATFLNCRATKRLARGSSHSTVQVLAGLATACQFSLILLLFFGLAGHNLLRFNWLWLAAFALLCRIFCKDLLAKAKPLTRPKSSGGAAHG